MSSTFPSAGKVLIKRLQEILDQALFWESARIFSPLQNRLLTQQGHAYLGLYQSFVAAKNNMPAHCLT